MEVTGKVLREVEFRDRLRGYDTDEVDEFLEKVAVGVDALTARIADLEAKLAASPAREVAAPPALSVDDDTIRRTLVLAQRTADLAIGEAREEASRLLDEARSEAEAVVARAGDEARRIRAESERELSARIARLDDERERLERDVRSLASLLEDERSRLAESLGAALRYVRDALAPSDELSNRAAGATGGAGASGTEEGAVSRPADDSSAAPPGSAEGPAATASRAPLAEGSGGDEPPGGQAGQEGPSAAGTALPDVEREIGEDAAKAAWSGRFEPRGGGHTGSTRRIGGGRETRVPSDEAPAEGEAEEALWERWAAGRDLGVVPGPADFGRRGSVRPRRDQGWSA